MSSQLRCAFLRMQVVFLAAIPLGLGLLHGCGGGGGGGGGAGSAGSGSAGGGVVSVCSGAVAMSGSGLNGGGPPNSSPCTVTVTTSDSPAVAYGKIEAATAGQTVCISPGTYQFRVTLAKVGTAGAPIVIRALDPANRPVFDYTSNTHDVTGWPGSYSASDAVRSAWRVTGAYYVIDGIVIQGANNAFSNWAVNDNTAGIRYLNSSNLTIRNSRLYNNDMGVQGGGSNTVIEYTEFDANGNPNTDQSHNIYILGGDNFTLRHSYSHDARGGQNFHVRARNATLAYNWFQNAADYEGDMMTNQTAYDAGNNGLQNLLFVGNVVVQNPTPANESKLITIYNDTGGAGYSMNLYALWNTFVFKEAARSSANTAVIRFSTSTLGSGSVVFSNNVVSAPASRSAIFTDGGGGSVAECGTNNYFPNGSSVSPIINTRFGTDVLFTDAATRDYSLQAGSPASGYASTAVTPQPGSSFGTPPTPGALLFGSMSSRASVTNSGAIQN